jgi:hypothetical protein
MEKMAHILLWEFIKEVTGIMARIECLKLLMQIALELGHLSGPLSDTEGEIAHALSKLSQAIMNDTSFVRESMQFSKIKTATGTTKSWNGYLRPTSQLSNPISLPGDRKELVCGSLTLPSF